MDIYVFDKSFNLLGIIDSFESLIWDREFYKTGSFKLHVTLPDLDKFAAEIISLLQKGNIIMKDDSPEEAAYIEDIVLDDEDSETIEVSGFFIDNFISERIVWGQQSYTGNIEEVIKLFVKMNAITPIDLNRIIPNLMLSLNRGISKPANEVNSYGNLADLTEELALKYEVGWRVLFDLENKKFLFDVYEGKDLSVNQTVNPQAIFSLEYENILKQSFKDSYAGFKNVALIAGQGEGAERKLAVINNNVTGFERRELFVDARDISLEKEDDTPIPENEYEAMLVSRGESKLAELQPIQTFESGISVLSNLIYKQDFDLGDKVTIQNNRWGITLNTRITSVKEIYEKNNKDIQVNFGSNIPTLIDRIAQKMR
ncbi:hypothetical protein F7731_08690 [Cytobacillus depressus]|uniref:Gp28/Gp37-like domain-containing protein n=1 Tax=Cytobacillus depressus TaxID=1602942 RepID=A0A6L3VDT3_9BACI|nr:siphovirus ReqiPepy6 Gp37-like family protein [Cytobacillus depressus]KAB2337660.1 hypothetical protein F7731_08690 [Cytobacillus depressus]